MAKGNCARLIPNHPELTLWQNAPLLPEEMDTRGINSYIVYLSNQCKLSSLRCQCLQCHFWNESETGGDSLTWAI